MDLFVNQMITDYFANEGMNSRQHRYDNFAPSGCPNYFEKIYDSDTDKKISFSVSKWGGFGGCGFEIWDHNRNKYWIDVHDKIIKKITEGPQAQEKQALLDTIPKEERTFDSLFTLFPEGFREKRHLRKRDPFEKDEYFELHDQFGDNGRARKQNREILKKLKETLNYTQNNSISLTSRKQKWEEYTTSVNFLNIKKEDCNHFEYLGEKIKILEKFDEKIQISQYDIVNKAQYGFEIYLDYLDKYKDEVADNSYWVSIDPIFKMVIDVHSLKYTSDTEDIRKILNLIPEKERTYDCLIKLFPKGGIQGNIGRYKEQDILNEGTQLKLSGEDFDKLMNILEYTQDARIDLNLRKQKWNEYYGSNDFNPYLFSIILKDKLGVFKPKNDDKGTHFIIRKKNIEEYTNYDDSSFDAYVDGKYDEIEFCGFNIYNLDDTGYWQITIDTIFNIITSIFYIDRYKDNDDSNTLMIQQKLFLIDEEKRTYDCLSKLFPNGFKTDMNSKGGKRSTKKNRKTKTTKKTKVRKTKTTKKTKVRKTKKSRKSRKSRK
jgi:hypothetical protein